MFIYHIVERCPNFEKTTVDKVVFDELNLFIPAENLPEAAEMLKGRDITSCRELCPVTEFPEQKYRFIPCNPEEAVQAQSTQTARSMLDEVETLLKTTKRSLVRQQKYDEAIKFRDAQKLVRIILDEPNSLDELLNRGKPDGIVAQLIASADKLAEHMDNKKG